MENQEVFRKWDQVHHDPEWPQLSSVEDAFVAGAEYKLKTTPIEWLMGFLPALSTAIPSPPGLAHFITVAQLKNGSNAILLLVNTVDHGQVFLQLTEEDFALLPIALVQDVRQKIEAQREVKS